MNSLAETLMSYHMHAGAQISYVMAGSFAGLTFKMYFMTDGMSWIIYDKYNWKYQLPIRQPLMF